MITKQQALEFIDELLSKQYRVFVDLQYGQLYVDTYITETKEILGQYGFNNHKSLSLENLVKLFIKENLNTDLLKRFDKIPVDIDMLEVGQAYKVHTQTDWEHNYFTSKFIGFDEEDNYILKFENRKPFTKYDIREIYKIWTIDIGIDDIQKTLQEEFERLCINGRVLKLEDKYDVVLNFVKELYNLKNDTLVSLHEACYNEAVSKEAEEILRKVGELK